MLDSLGAVLMCGTDSSAVQTVVTGRMVVAYARLLSADERRIVDGTNAATDVLTDRVPAVAGVDFLGYPAAGRASRRQ